MPSFRVCRTPQVVIFNWLPLDPQAATMTNSSAVLMAVLPHFADWVLYEFILLDRIVLGQRSIPLCTSCCLPLWNLLAQVFENYSARPDLQRSMPLHIPSTPQFFPCLIHLFFLLVSKFRRASSCMSETLLSERYSYPHPPPRTFFINYHPPRYLRL